MKFVHEKNADGVWIARPDEDTIGKPEWHLDNEDQARRVAAYLTYITNPNKETAMAYVALYFDSSEKTE